MFKFSKIAASVAAICATVGAATVYAVDVVVPVTAADLTQLITDNKTTIVGILGLTLGLAVVAMFWRGILRFVKRLGGARCIGFVTGAAAAGLATVQARAEAITMPITATELVATITDNKATIVGILGLTLGLAVVAMFWRGILRFVKRLGGAR